MRIFVAGGSGVLGRRLVPQLVARGHLVTASATNADKLAEVAGLGAEAVIMDGLDAVAEDVVQKAWLRYDATPAEPASARAFLAAVVTRLSIDALRSARLRRERYVGPWFPEPLLGDPYVDPERSAELADSLSMAALLLLERLSPIERAVFVLREVFGFSFAEIASAVGRSEAACRQLAFRARRHMDAGRPRFEADPAKRAQLAERFFAAFREGNVGELQALLASDARLVADSGGNATLRRSSRSGGRAGHLASQAGGQPAGGRLVTGHRLRWCEGTPADSDARERLAAEGQFLFSGILREGHGLPGGPGEAPLAVADAINHLPGDLSGRLVVPWPQASCAAHEVGAEVRADGGWLGRLAEPARMAAACPAGVSW